MGFAFGLFGALASFAGLTLSGLLLGFFAGEALGFFAGTFGGLMGFALSRLVLPGLVFGLFAGEAFGLFGGFAIGFGACERFVVGVADEGIENA